MNSSRNKLIDDLIHPGPWKEILPCKDLCHDLVQSCPASMGFVCPLEGEGLESYGYGSFGSNRKDKNITCNYPGNPWLFSNAAYTVANDLLLIAVMSLSLLLHLGS
jgi:calcium channel MID1